MGAEVFLCAFSLVFAFACAFCLVAGASAGVRRVRARVDECGANGSSVSSGSGDFLHSLYAYCLRNGVATFKGVARVLLKIGTVLHFIDNLVEWVCAEDTLGHNNSTMAGRNVAENTSTSAAGYNTMGHGAVATMTVGTFATVRNQISTNREAMCSLLVGVFLVCGVLTSLIARNPVAGVAVDALIVMVLVLRVQAWHDVQDDAMREGVPNSLNTMGECFQSGYSLVQTMQMVADQSRGKLAQIFRKCVNMLQLGSSSSEALGALRADAKVGELSFVAVALDVQHQTGGSITSVLGAAQQMVQDKIDLRRSLQVQTAQARLSARVVCIMPFVLAFVLSMVSEGFLTPFFSSPAGFVMLGVALLMEGAGVVMVRRMLKVAL